MSKWSPWLGLLLSLLVSVAGAHDFGGGTNNDPPPPPEPPPPCQRSAGQCCADAGAGEGDPISTYNGGQYLSYTDLTHGAVFPIQLVRRFDSRSRFDSALGYGWAFDHDRRLFKYPDGSVIIRSGCGRRDHFVKTGGAYVTPRDAPQGVLTEFPDGQFEYRYPNGKRDRFDADGRLVAIENRAGQRHEFQYDPGGRLPLIGTSPHAVNPDTPMVVAYQPRLTRITEHAASGAPTGYAVDLEYSDTTGRLTRIVASDGRQIAYAHDEIAGATRGNLRTVAGLEDYVQGFSYTGPSDAHRLTAFVDGVDAAPVVNTYNEDGQVIRQVQGGSTVELDYSTPGVTVATEIVTSASGAELQRRVRTREFDEAGYMTRKVDAEGHEERYIYNASKDRIRTELWEKQADGALTLLKAIDNTYNGQAQKLTQSVTLDSGETISTRWTYDHGQIASEETVSSADPQVFRTEYDFVRDAQGTPLNIAAVKRRNDDGSFVTTTYTYCSAAEAGATNSTCPDTSLLKVVDGPRTDVNDTITYAYYGNTDISGCGQGTGPCHRVGDKHKSINALGQTTEYLRYDAAGRVIRARNANGVITEMTYHPRGWLLEQAVRGPDDAVTSDDAISRYAYDPRGNRIRQTQPDGVQTEFEYDARNRLVEVRDATGGAIHYTLDSIGNRWQEDTFDADGTLRRTLSRSFNRLDQPVTQTGAQNQTAAFTYDGGGRQIVLTDPLGTQTHHTYDDLGRLRLSVSDAAAGGLQITTRFAYDAAGSLRQVIDPNGLATTYQYNALGQLLQLDSPDTGITTYRFDAAGNRIEQTDARGETATFTYDALNRPTGIRYSDAAFNVSYGYDVSPDACETGETFAQGRLTIMTDRSGLTQYCYDRFGNLVRKVQTTDGTALAVRYLYGPGQPLRAVIYPDGATVDYIRGPQGRVTEVGVAPAGNPRRVLLSGASYYPFGPSAGWDYDGGRRLTRQHDQDYRPQRIHDPMAGGLDLGFNFDATGNLTELYSADLANPPLAKFDYDSMSRLTALRDGIADAIVEAYAYDATGNRTQLSNAGGSQVYSYATDSHRLVEVAGVPRSYDASGNTTAIGGTSQVYRYSPSGRMINTLQGGTVKASYWYNGRGEQVRRNTPVSITSFVYSEIGQLLGQYLADGRPLQQYIWMDDLPVGVIVDGMVYSVEPDHLGAPRTIIDSQRQTSVWTWELKSDAFGNNPPKTDPDGDGMSFVYDLRFPGQRFDAASGLNQNYFREYESRTGRYSQPDPIGQVGGAALYGYVRSNPLVGVDYLGLMACKQIWEVVNEYDGKTVSTPGAESMYSSFCLPLPGIGTPSANDMLPDPIKFFRGQFPYSIPISWSVLCTQSFYRRSRVERAHVKQIQYSKVCTDDCGGVVSKTPVGFINQVDWRFERYDDEFWKEHHLHTEDGTISW